MCFILSAAVDLPGGLAAVPAVEQIPQAIHRQGQETEDQHDLEVQAVQELPDLCNGKQQRILVDVLPGHQIHHADGLPGQLQLHRTHHIALLDGRTDVVRQMEIFLGHRAVPRGGQQGHHAVRRVELQGVGIGGILHRDLRQRKVGIQRGLNGKAVKHPVNEPHRLVQRRAAVRQPKKIAGVRASHHTEDVGRPVLVRPGSIALGAAVVLVGRHIAHPALHGTAVVGAPVVLVQRGILADQHRGRPVFFLGRHRKAGRGRDLHKGVKAHQIAQDQVHIHRTGHVSAVDAAGVRPGAVRGADALGQGIHLVHPVLQIPAGQGVGQTHGRLVGIAGHHGVQRLPVGKRLVGAHIRVAGVVHIIRDGKRHLEGVVQLVGVVGQHQRDGHIFGQAAGGYLPGAVLVVNDDVGVGVDDVGAGSLHLIHRAGIKHGSCRHHQTAEQDHDRQKQCKNSFHVDNSFKKR